MTAVYWSVVVYRRIRCVCGHACLFVGTRAPHVHTPYLCVRACVSGGVIMLADHPSPPLDLLSQPPSLFIYPDLIQSSSRSLCGKGSLPRQPSVTEQCIRTLRHPLLRQKSITHPRMH